MSSVSEGRPTAVTVDLDALQWNCRQVRRLIGTQVRLMAVVKADAYGHGAVACSRAFASAGADAFGVATVEEGIELRQAGLKQPIAVLGLIQPAESGAVLRHGLQPTVVSWEQARSLSRAAAGRICGFHLKIDTGMGRIGLAPNEAGAFARRIRRLSGASVAGVFTHFAHADGRDKRLLRSQMERLAASLEAVRAAGWDRFAVHAANSAAVMEAPETYRDMVRPGLMLYGLYPADRLRSGIVLKPALRWTTRIVQIKTVPAGVGLSYGHTFTTRRISRIATLPVGYADGFSRRFSNSGQALVAGRACPIVGRVCMDMCLVDVTAAPAAKVGDEAVLIGRQKNIERPADDLATELGTISYEVVCGIGHRVPRHYRGGSRQAGAQPSTQTRIASRISPKQTGAQPSTQTRIASRISPKQTGAQ